MILWARWKQRGEEQMDEAFALYEKWGVAGVKIDFMDSDDQEMVNFYHPHAEEGGRAPPRRRLPRHVQADGAAGAPTRTCSRAKA